jgi:GH25 family lysozyme M1 (1,4-beta-N-acetylmuramidase)
MTYKYIPPEDRTIEENIKEAKGFLRSVGDYETNEASDIINLDQAVDEILSALIKIYEKIGGEK